MGMNALEMSRMPWTDMDGQSMNMAMSGPSSILVLIVMCTMYIVKILMVMVLPMHGLAMVGVMMENGVMIFNVRNIVSIVAIVAMYIQIIMDTVAIYRKNLHLCMKEKHVNIFYIFLNHCLQMHR